MEYIEHDGWIAAVTTGRLDSSEALLAQFREILQTGAQRVLVDNREVSMAFDALDVSQVARQLVEEGVPSLGIRFAGLFTEPMADAFHFLETTMRNNSLRGRIFTDRAEALAWLTS